jgi:ADP-heptose:LPS heptosyltransferase
VKEVFFMHDYLQYYAPRGQEKPDTPRFLITLDVGIGDAVALGSSAVDQIIENDPLAAGKIDVLCNKLQAQIFEYDPRINRIVETSKLFFPGDKITQWFRGIILDTESATVVRFLRQRHYEAVFPSTIALGLYSRLHSHLMYPRLSEMAKNFLAFRRLANIHESIIARQMVNHYFRKKTSAALRGKDIPLYISSEHVQKAVEMMANLQGESAVEKGTGKVLVVAPDTGTTVTRPPIDLLVAALAFALTTSPHLIVYILPSYTVTTRSRYLYEALGKSYPRRVFLMPAEPRTHLLEVAALIDQADMFITGDTGVMHLAAAQKKLWKGDDVRFVPKNAVRIVALFGGTNPGYFGYSRHTIVVGRGRKEQIALRPGFSKAFYDPKGRNMFDHISSQQIADAILSQ